MAKKGIRPVGPRKKKPVKKVEESTIEDVKIYDKPIEPPKSVEFLKPKEDTYKVHVYCTNCQKPTLKELKKGTCVGTLKPYNCPRCGCPALDINELPYKTVISEHV